MLKILKETAHRPWPLPGGPWIMAQSWHDLLFAHWPVKTEILRPLIPSGLAIDNFDGTAWIGIVPFSMTGVRLRGTPPLPWLSAFPELNVRTYVTAENKPGVWFFSLDAANALAVAAARITFHLPYFRARMNCKKNEDWIQYRSERVHRGAPEATLLVKYKPLGETFAPRSATLERFLTERYCLYSADAHGRIFRGEIHHPEWALQRVEAEFSRNSMVEAAGVTLPRLEPLLHFARRQDMVAWAPQRITS
jgi:uncharacterized protein